jgi:hypothetical protein
MPACADMAMPNTINRAAAPITQDRFISKSSN